MLVVLLKFSIQLPVNLDIRVSSENFFDLGKKGVLANKLHPNENYQWKGKKLLNRLKSKQ